MSNDPAESNEPTVSRETKRRVVVLFGGRSAEHEVSCTSAVWVLQSLDQTKYDVTAIGITGDGTWVVSDSARALLQQAQLPSYKISRVLAEGDAVSQHSVLGAAVQTGAVPVDGSAGAIRSLALHDSDTRLAVVIPVLHGPYGEDGTVQGMLELAGVPYVGSGVLASAIAMDKVVAKTLFRAAGLPQADYCSAAGWELETAAAIEVFELKCASGFGYPMFVKPANLGSSVGVSKVTSHHEFAQAVQVALSFDDWVIVEQGIDGREIEFAVLGNEHPMVSVAGEILPGHDFYDYNDKYLSNASSTKIPADLPPDVVTEGQKLATQAYAALRCEGLSRVDFFYDDGSVRPNGRTPRGWLINEINTIPGCTPISMYPKLWEASGVAGREVLDRLIDLAVARHDRRSGRVGRSR